MKKFLKVLAWIIIVFIILVGAIAVTIKLSENQITDFALEKVSESIEAPVQIGRVNFNIVRKFPYASIELENVWLGASDIMGTPDSTYTDSDSLLFIKHIYVAVNTRSFLNSKYEIVNVELSGLDLTYNVDTAGATNFDFLMVTDTTMVEEEVVEVDTAPAILDVLLSDLTLTDITLNYNDESMNAYAKLHIPELNVKGTVYDTSYTGKVKGSVLLTDCGFEDYNVNLMQKTYLQFDVSYENDSAFVNNIKLETDGLDFEVLGSAAIGDSIYTNLKVNLSKVDLGELIKYAPKEMLDEFGVEKVAGVISMESEIKGIYADSTMLPQVDATIKFKNGEVLTKDYPPLRNLYFNGTFTNGELQNNSTTAANFPEIHFETDQSKFDIGFTVVNIDNPKYTFKTDMDIVIQEFKDFIPDSTVESIDGNVHFALSTYGTFNGDVSDAFIEKALNQTNVQVDLSDFNVVVDSSLAVYDFNTQLKYYPGFVEINKLGLNVPAYNVKLNNSAVKAKILGHYADQNSLGVELQKFIIRTDSSSFGGRASIRNFNQNPKASIQGFVNLNLAELATMAPDTLFEELSGDVSLNYETLGNIYLDSLETQMEDIAFNKVKFRMELNDINVDLPNDSMVILNDFSGKVRFSRKLIAIDDVEGKFQGLSFGMDSTTIENVYETIIQERRDKQLIVQTNVMLGEITNEFLAAMMGPEDTTTVDSALVTEDIPPVDSLEMADSLKEPEPLLPDYAELGVPHFIVRGKLTIDHVSYEKNEIDDISLLFRFADSLYVIDQFKLKMCQGEINTSLLLDARKWDSPKVDVKNTISGLDIKQLLEDNDNFGDTALTSENLSGILTSELHARAFYVDGDWPTNKISSKGHFTLEDGKVLNYEPLVEISKSLKTFGGLRELDQLEFSTLKTSIFMWKDKIYVPKTDVVSSALDLSAFAMQDMNDDYEYHIVLHLGDVLTGKSDKLMKAQKKQNKKDGGTVERNGINLIAMDIEGETKYGFDNEKLKKKFKNSINKQQGFLNLLFNPLLVNFSTDLDRTKRNKEILEKYGKN